MMNESSPERPKSKLWTPEVLAEHLSVPISWVYKRTRKKNAPETIPPVKLGKYVRFDPESEAFREWLMMHGVGLPPAADGLTIPFTANRVQATEKTGQIH